MTFANPITVLAFAIFAAGFTAGAAFAGFICFLETRKWRKRDRVWIGIDPARADDGCTVYGHCTADGKLRIDHVVMDGERR